MKYRNFGELRLAIKAQRIHETEAKAVKDKEIAKAKELYAGELLQKTIAEETVKYDMVRNDGRSEIIKEINDMRTAKINQLKSSITTPIPVEKAMMLSDLRNREHISESEIKVIAESLKDSYGAMRTLAEIADKNGFLLPVPDYDTMCEKVNDACDYAIEMLKDESENYGTFGFYSDIEKTQYEYLIEGLDDDGFIATPAPKIRTITDGEKNMLDKLFAGTDSEKTLAERVNEIYTSVPEMQEVIKISEYAGFVEDGSEG